ncbi:MAG: VCBS repeat-containing protein [Flavobacteriales bacterium]|nr:VCBS repeat-containing protein [Flavobacteriales bacterium]
MGASTAIGQNSCSTALAIVPGTYTVTAIDGPEAPSPICIETGIATGAEWYKYTPTQDTTVRLTTDLPGSGDTRFHVYTGNCGSLECVIGDDDGGSGLTSMALFDAVGGVTYHIAFDNNWSPAGFSFSLTELAPVIPAEGQIHFTQTTVPGLTVGDCVVDMNGDDLDDVVSASTTSIRIQYQLPTGGFNPVNITTAPAVHSPSWSIVAGDIDGNGYNDLLYGGGQGASLMMANSTGTGFTPTYNSEYIFCQRTNMVDINNDGNLDGFSCHDVDDNVALMNDGNGNISYVQGGLGLGCGNYGSLWTDFDNDGDQDMFVARCGCNPVDILMRNNGDGSFTDVAPGLGFADNHQSWSSAWGDFDNDEDMDVLIGSSSSNYQKLMRNNGDGTFTNVTLGSGFDTFTGQSIEWCTHDFNNDGNLDVLGGGSLMFGNGALAFTPETMGSAPYSGAVGDLNNDGFLDVMAFNQPFMNDGNDNNWLKVSTVGTSSNLNGIGARITVTSTSGVQIREVRSGDAFSTMSSLIAHFGLGSDEVIDEVRIRWPSGIVNVITDVSVNTTISLVEGVNTAVVENADAVGLRTYPNPAQDQLFVELPAGRGTRTVTVLDVAGQQVTPPTTLVNNRLDVSGLSSGVYLVQVQQDGTVHQRTFVKQ